MKFPIKKSIRIPPKIESKFGSYMSAGCCHKLFKLNGDFTQIDIPKWSPWS